MNSVYYNAIDQMQKTAKGILPVGEFLANEAGELVDVPDKEQMVRVLKMQMSRLPFLVFGDKEEPD